MEILTALRALSWLDWSAIGVVILLGVVGLLAAGWYAHVLRVFCKSLMKMKKDWPRVLNKLQKIQKGIKKLEGVVESIQSSIDSGSPLSEAHSPQSLNDAGKKVSNDINAKSIADKYEKFMSIEEGTNAYDIQQACFQFASTTLYDEHLTDDEKNLIKEVAYETGTTEKMILRIVIGIVLRDKILAEQGIDQKQVDTDTRIRAN